MSASKTTGKTAVKPTKGVKKTTTTKTSTKPATSKATTSKAKPKIKEKSVEINETVPVKKPRRVVSRESIITDFDSLLSVIDGHIGDIRTNNVNKIKNKGITITSLKTMIRHLKQLRTDVSRNVRNKKKRNESGSSTSGFQKPVNISDEMSKFAGWTTGDQHSRVEVTKSICKYIKDNNLQNPEDRRQIKPDVKLTRLLKYKPGGEPLTYYSLQKLIQIHFIKA